MNSLGCPRSTESPPASPRHREVSPDLDQNFMVSGDQLIDGHNFLGRSPDIFGPSSSHPEILVILGSPAGEH